MTIKDKYYNNRNVDYNGNNLTIEVGSFLVNGNLLVSGSITGAETSGVDLNTDDDLYITGNSDWYFDNDNKNILIFNDLYKKFAIGFDAENRSLTFDSSFRDNPIFFFSGTTDAGDYGLGTGSSYVARFENYSNTAGCSGIDISLNRSSTNITSANKFINFSGHSGSSAEHCGSITGIVGDDGIRISSSGKMILDGADDIKIESDGDFIIEADNMIVSAKGNQTSIPVEGIDTVSQGSWFFPDIKRICFYDYDRRFDILTGLNYPSDRELGSVVTNTEMDYFRTSIKLPLKKSNSLVLGANIMWGQGVDDLISETDVGIGAGDWFPSDAALGQELGIGVGWKLRWSTSGDDYYYIDIYINRELLMTDASQFHTDSASGFTNVAYTQIDLVVTVEYRDK